MFALKAEECLTASAGPSLTHAGPGAWVEMEPVCQMSKYLKLISQLNQLLHILVKFKKC